MFERSFTCMKIELTKLSVRSPAKLPSVLSSLFELPCVLAFTPRPQNMVSMTKAGGTVRTTLSEQVFQHYATTTKEENWRKLMFEGKQDHLVAGSPESQSSWKWYLEKKKKKIRLLSQFIVPMQLLKKLFHKSLKVYPPAFFFHESIFHVLSLS